MFETLMESAASNWPYWLVSTVLVVAAVIDGIKLKVPNYITFPMIITGWVYSAIAYGIAGDGWYVGLGWSLAGTALGLALLLPAYAIGGMGAGDVKLLAGVGAWVYCEDTFYGFAFTVVVGAIIAVGQILYKRGLKKHSNQFMSILNEIVTIRDPETLAQIAADRKPTMTLLPYGIPMAIGTILYFAWMGLLV